MPAQKQRELRGRLKQLTMSSLSNRDDTYQHKKVIRHLTVANFQGVFLDDIKKVIDELNIMIRTSQQHRNILQRFQEHAEGILNPYDRWRDKGRSTRGNGSGSGFWVDNEDRRGEVNDAGFSEEQFFWFRTEAERLISKIEGRIEVLEGILKTAETTSHKEIFSNARQINEVHNLILQQANILQAWQAGEEAAETVQHGRTIMVFTIVTVVFVRKPQEIKTTHAHI
ncbi:hypothetical protein Brms1b_009683 [Colletotrichum noveboracense]|nr:hypothetical protein CBS470a_009546 [Colletotrichum nupharicola]KAJ0308111.1 hypothetical protein Brms1b_009683 [Colletotrichum noveboracense]